VEKEGLDSQHRIPAASLSAQWLPRVLCQSGSTSDPDVPPHPGWQSRSPPLPAPVPHLFEQVRPKRGGRSRKEAGRGSSDARAV